MIDLSVKCERHQSEPCTDCDHLFKCIFYITDKSTNDRIKEDLKILNECHSLEQKGVNVSDTRLATERELSRLIKSEAQKKKRPNFSKQKSFNIAYDRIINKLTIHEIMLKYDLKSARSVYYHVNKNAPLFCDNDVFLVENVDGL